MNDQECDPIEGELERRAAGLGRAAAERLDVERVVAGVLTRLRQEPAPSTPFWVRPAWLRLAAGVVLLIGVGVVARGGPSRTAAAPAVDVAWTQTADVQELDADQLQRVLASLDAPVDRGAVVGEAGVEDLSETQLRALLRSMED